VDVSDIIARLGAAAVLGGGIGLNRFLHRKSVGIRTLGLVAIVAAAVVAGVEERFGADAASRAIQGIVTGIGFIGAGVIVHGQNQNSIHGLTTAATVWVSAAIGILCGLGVWLVTLTGFALVFLLLVFGGGLETWAAKRYGAPDDEPPSLV
jgi:putative Mg2+ transporter-C (MgtC) family protein